MSRVALVPTSITTVAVLCTRLGVVYARAGSIRSYRSRPGFSILPKSVSSEKEKKRGPSYAQMRCSLHAAWDGVGACSATIDLFGPLVIRYWFAQYSCGTLRDARGSRWLLRAISEVMATVLDLLSKDIITGDGHSQTDSYYQCCLEYTLNNLSLGLRSTPHGYQLPKKYSSLGHSANLSTSSRQPRPGSRSRVGSTIRPVSGGGGGDEGERSDRSRYLP
jgi:hypothetical protein